MCEEEAAPQAANNDAHDRHRSMASFLDVGAILILLLSVTSSVVILFHAYQGAVDP